VAPPAAEEIFFPQPERERRAVLARHGLAERYVLSVAALEANKNTMGALEAYRLAGGLPRLGGPLVLAGRTGAGEAGLRRALDAWDMEDQVRLLGHVPREDLPALYSAAACFVWPSLYEGFGLPPLEAMACGTPVISSGRDPMPQVLGGAALFVDPTRPDEMAEALLELAGDPHVADDLALKGQARAAHFSWEATAERVLACVEEAAGRGGADG
jgi:glycosyltransferase involved in cell wall biosynthesis